MPKTSHKLQILRLLADNIQVSNGQLNKICFRYSPRILDLRRSGFDIDGEADESNRALWWFTLRTPRELIDWDKMRVKIVKIKQGELKL